jgi:alpha-N-arabinofuranosidase
MTRPLYYERFYHAVDSLARADVPGHPIALSIDEYGLAVPERMQHGMDAALYGARMMLVFERASPIVAMSAVSDMVNGWPGGIIQAGRERAFVSPLYYANRMFAERVGRDRLRTTIDGPVFGDDPTRPGALAPAVDAVASRSVDGRRIFVKLVNTDPTRGVDARIAIRGAAVARTAEWEVLSAPSPTARNDFATPDAIVPRRSSSGVTDGTLTVRLPARAVEVVVFEVGGG